MNTVNQEHSLSEREQGDHPAEERVYALIRMVMRGQGIGGAVSSGVLGVWSLIMGRMSAGFSLLVFSVLSVLSQDIFLLFIRPQTTGREN